MIALAIVVFHVLGGISSIHAVMNTRTEQGAIAWAVSLNTFPYLAVPAYWVLGRSRFQGYVRDVSRSLWTLERRSLRSSVSCTLHLHAA